MISVILSREEYLRAVSCTVEFLKSKGLINLQVSYGFDCNCPNEQLFQNVELPLDRLVSFIGESEEAGYYTAGANELHVTDVKRNFELTLCHESDIHFTSNDLSLVADLGAVWRTNSIAISKY